MSKPVARQLFWWASARFVRVVRYSIMALFLCGVYAGCSAADTSSGESETLGTSSEALTTAQIWGFESASGWTITNGTANKQSSTIHDEGSFSLQLTAPGFVAVRGDAVVKPSALSPLLAVDVMIPTQAGPYYFGAVQMVITVPSLNINSQWVNQRELSVPTGVWQTLTFQLPSTIYQQLLSSSFSDLQITIGLNSPVGLNQPFRFDNLRFLSAPGCVGQPNGTLCNDSVTCTTGDICTGGVCGTVTPPPPGGACDPGDDVMGFENFPAWQVTNGAAALAPSTTHVQGVRSLQITTSNFMTVSSINLATLHKVSSTLSLRVQKPTNQPNPSWHGDVTLNMVVPSRSINFSQTKQLTGQPSGSFFELTFQVPTATVQNLASNTYSDLKFSISVNPPSGQTGSYLLDDLHFVPVTSCTGAVNKTACEDSSACTQGDSCQSGVCGVTVTCNDGNLCTSDSCNAATGCVFAPNTLACNDGNACTSGDVCGGGACAGTTITCNDGNVCTNDSCSTATGCVFTANTASCSDGNACTTGDVCNAGACISGAPTVCNDGNPCTDETCVPATGCVYTNTTALCSDGNVCTGVLPDGTDSCSAGTCSVAPAISCDDGSNCTADSCVNPGGCVHTNACGSGICIGTDCCFPKTCFDLKAECGTPPDSCGGTVNCTAACPDGGSCNPAGQCLRPNSFKEKTGINVCETLLEDIILHTPITTDVTECIATLDFSDPLSCIFGIFSGHIDCCFSAGACFGDPACIAVETVTTIVDTVVHAGELYCDFRSPDEYLLKVLNGAISTLEQWELFVTTGGLAGLIDFDIAILTQVGNVAPANVRQIVRDLTAPIYDGGATGFSYDLLDSVKIVSSDFPTAGLYLPGARAAITLGPVIIMNAKYYDALFSGANSGVDYTAFLTDAGVCSTFTAAVDILVHELVHARQADELGRVNFYTQYLGSALVNEYGDIGFEEEAFDYHIQLSELQGGQYCAVMANNHNDFISDFTLSTPPNTCAGTGPTDLEDFPVCP